MKKQSFKKKSPCLSLKTYSKYFIIATLLLCLNGSVYSNNIQVSNISLTGQNTTDHFTMVQFDLSWDNSWHIDNSGPTNWDAAWVFVKYRQNSETEWHHATLNWADGSGSGDGHTVPAGCAIEADDDTVPSGGSHGVFIHASTNIIPGSVNYQGIQLRWNHGVDGLLDGDRVEICVFAVEMVYVPEGNLIVASTTASGNEFQFDDDGLPSNFYIYGESINIPIHPAILYYQGGGDQMGTISPSFPKGYAAFYCMKYEISQEQYVAYLNKLTFTQASNIPLGSSDYRNNISVDVQGVYSTTTPNVPANYLNWSKLGHYLSWAALRPMTEFEFEKACRGSAIPSSDEYAWGTNKINANPYSLNNAGTGTEGIQSNYSTGSTEGNSMNKNTSTIIDGPVRGGIFAANPANTGRVTAGASFYGIMELSGNLAELVVTVGTPQGRQFTHAHGKGSYNTPGWYSNNIQAGVRGGSWESITEQLLVTDRTFGILPANSDSHSDWGGRGVRSAPQ